MLMKNQYSAFGIPQLLLKQLRRFLFQILCLMCAIIIYIYNMKTSIHVDS